MSHDASSDARKSAAQAQLLEAFRTPPDELLELDRADLEALRRALQKLP